VLEKSIEKSLMWILDCCRPDGNFSERAADLCKQGELFLAVIMRISEARTSNVMLCPRRVNAVASYKAPPAVL
jgi:hypothetical protein